MHRLRHEAHQEVYGGLNASNSNISTSRTDSPRRGADGRHTKIPEREIAGDAPGLSGVEGLRPSLSVQRVSSPPLVATNLHPPVSVDVPPDISEHSTSSRLAELKVIFLRILLFSWINVLLVMIPVALAVHFSKQNEIAVFVSSCVAIIPLAALLGYSTEELAKHFGPASGALMNVTFGNATELIVFILGIVKGELNVVQAAIIGSVLGNLLLILGMAFVLGGLRFKEQRYNHTVTQTTGCLLLLAITSLSIPTAFHASFSDSALADTQVLHLSYATSIVLLLMYGIYMLFQLKTHAYLYKVVIIRDQEENPQGAEVMESTTTEIPIELHTIGHYPPSVSGEEVPGADNSSDRDTTIGGNDDEAPQIPILASVLLLVISTALVAVMAEFMVDSIQAVVATTTLSEQFVGLIILPLVGNAAEHITAVTVAYKNKMDLSIGIALGSSLQIVLLVAPLAVLLGWAMGQPLTLYFSLFETLSVFATVLIVTYLVIDGRSNYLEGALLIAAYILIAIASIFYPSVSDEAS